MTCVSVVLPTYNRAALLPRAIASVLGQSFTDLELIVVDDHSTDDTAAVVAAFSDPRLRYERLDARGGVSAARNRGIALGSGDWVALQDSDDAWRPRRLELQLRAARADSVLIVTRDEVPDDPSMSFRGPRGPAVMDWTAETAWRLPPAATWLARRDALRAAGGFDPTLDCYEDWELALRLAARGGVLLVNEVLVERHKSPGSLFSDEAARLRNLRIIVERHRAALTRHPRAWAYYCNALGQMTARAGALAEARRWFRRALRARPLDPRAWSNLAAAALGARAFNRYVGLARALARLRP